MDFPYRAEYSKSNRASCRGCKSVIAKDVLRLAVMVQSPMFDGKTPHWYHEHCFFSKQRPKTVDDISHFESLRWEDQEKIRSKIGTGGASVVVPDKKGKKRDAAAASAKKSALSDYVIEYSKSSRAGCRGCEQKIMKEEVRISKKDFESDVGKRYGGQDMWHHLTCFAKLRSELGYYESGDKLPGFKSLRKEDQAEVKKQLPVIKQEDIPEEKKVKLEDETDAGKGDANNSQDAKLKSQNKIMFKYRDQLKPLKKQELQLLLTANDQEVPVGADSMLDRLADIMTFGVLEPCKVCKGGQFVFNKLGYMCQGNLTEWSKCGEITKEPKRRPFVVPSELAEEYSFLKKYKYVPRTRIIKDVNPTVSGPLLKKEKEEVDAGPKIQRDLPPLYNMEFVLVGNLSSKKDALKKKIVLLGGKVTTKIKETVMAVISTEADVEKMGARIREAQEADVHVVPEDFLDEAKDYSGRIPELVVKKSICTWGTDPHTRLPPEPSSSSNLKSKSRSMFTSSMPSKVKLTLKSGGAVDPESGLADRAHIYQKGKDKYSVVLGLTDIQKQKNSYYKLQLLESDGVKRYWLFRAWGRIGTTIGGTKVEDMDTVFDAVEQFRQLYEEKTGNTWENRHNFVKVPGRMYPVDVDYGEDEAELQLSANLDEESKLPKPVQELVQLIFDVNSMKKLMMEFELDTEKMPLGKLSKAQLQSAYGVLTELQQLIESKAPLLRLVDASNRFYTFVPHSFGIEDPPVIDDLETIKKKIEMIDNLMEIEIAYNLMKSSNTHTIDAHYEQLKTEIDVLSRDSEEYKIIKDYVKNTHAATHSNYSLNIEEVYTVKRQGEEKRFKPFRKLHNRKLLWHGSRTTNYAGILSQGLRIAPPEAPVTGYMFGKGIYFADMVSKSANYCCPSNGTGLMLLSEVALGEMHELYHAKYVEKLPKGKHSVKGVGRTEPDPAGATKIHGDVEVPIGKGKDMDRPNATSLLYNEYIIYDVAQVNIKYLIKMEFKYKY